MEKLKFSLRLLSFTCLFLSFVNINKAQAQEQRYADVANEFYKQMEQKHYDIMYQMFNERMKSELTLEDLKTNIEQMYVTHGKVLKTDSVLIKSMPPLMITIKPIYFEKSSLELRLALEKDLKVGGLFFTIFEPKKTTKNLSQKIIEKTDKQNVLKIKAPLRKSSISKK